MLTSTSSVLAASSYNNPMFFVKRQVLSLAIGVVGSLVCMRVPYSYWRMLAPAIGVIVVFLLVMTLIPGVGINLKGSSRWLRLGPFNLQPSELGKFALIIAMARWLSSNGRKIKTFRSGLIIPLVIIGVFVLPVLKSPDFGTTALMALVGLSMMFVAGTRLSYLFVTVAVGVSGFVLMVSKNEVRMRRILAFLNPEKYKLDEAYQLDQAINAFVIGGLRGVGLGDSSQKRFYLPEAHTDFIFAIIGEELGFVFSMVVVLLFVGLFLLGLYIALRSHDLFGRLLAFGITMMLTVQALINICVACGLLPTKGLALPFISYGGTSMVVSLAMVGVMANIAYLGSEHQNADVVKGDRTIHL